MTQATDSCGTCDGSGELIYDGADAFGERTDDVVRCQECRPDDEVDFDDRDAEERYRFAFDYDGAGEPDVLRSPL